MDSISLFGILCAIGWTIMLGILALIGYEVWLVSYTRAKWLNKKELKDKWKETTKFIKKL